MSKKPVALVLDDDELFRKMMEKVLDRLGVKAHTVASVADFAAKDAEVKPDAYLIDVHVGEANGIDVVARVRAARPSVPIFVISGDHEGQVVAHALEIGANDFIRKPFNRTLLAAKLGQLIRTEEIEEVQRLIDTDDQAASPAKVHYDAEIASVDELGFGLVSKHLLPKGSVVRIGGSFVQEVGGTPDCLICVTSTALRPDGGYDIYAEFETTSVEFLQSVRRWLARELSPKSA